ncbi:MAG: transposase [Candidatus Moraniibacteriota bacterium]
MKYYDAENKRYYDFLTNSFSLPATTIEDLYRYRWQVELFFKWIKQNLKIQSFWGYSENAVKTQIWTAITSYVLVAIIKKQCEFPHSMNEILQILSISLFDKTPLNQLFSGYEQKNSELDSENQLKLAGF